MAVRRRLGGALTGFSKGALSGIGMTRQQELLEALRGQGTDELKSVGDLIPATDVERLELPLPPTTDVEPRKLPLLPTTDVEPRKLPLLPMEPALPQDLLRILRELDLFSGR